MRKVGAAAWLRPAAALLSIALVAIAYVTPIWVSRLDAPQYPKGLWLLVWADRLSGNVNEVNGLNHYIGMRAISPDLVPELGLWWLGLVSAAIFAIGGLYLHETLAVLARIALWAVPVTVVVDIQRWLYIFGHDLSPDAALRMKPFTPLAIGPTKVWNFEILALPGPALAALLVVALLVTLVPRLPKRSVPTRHVTGSAIAALLILVLGLSACAPATVQERVPAAQYERAVVTFDLATAIRTAPDGVTIHVPPGRYAPIVIARPLSLHAGGDAVIGGGRGAVVTIAAPDVTFEGFIVERSGGQVEDGAGILVTSDRVTLTRNTIRDSYVGILARNTRDLKVIGNVIRGSNDATTHQVSLDASHHAPAAGATGDGIWLHATESTLIRGNDISSMRDGIYLSYAEETLVDDNRIHDLRYGLHAMFGADLMIFGNHIFRNASGLVLMNTSSLEAARNQILDHRSDATGYGVLLKDTSGVRLIENVIARGQVGIRAEGVDRARARAEVLTNRVAGNSVGVQLFPTARLVFSRNSFEGNLVQVDTPGAAAANGSEWMKSGLGNEWSTYAGYDLDGDGIGDVAHAEGGSSQRLLTRAPELRALRTSFAYSLLARAERWWDVGRAQRVVDRLPLTIALAPQLEPAARSLTDTVAFGGFGLLIACALALAVRVSR